MGGVSERPSPRVCRQESRDKGPRRAPLGLDHRNGGIKAALQLAGEGMGFGHGHVADLFDGLTTTA